jgi:hypothetical protein
LLGGLQVFGTGLVEQRLRAGKLTGLDRITRLGCKHDDGGIVRKKALELSVQVLVRRGDLAQRVVKVFWPDLLLPQDVEKARQRGLGYPQLCGEAFMALFGNPMNGDDVLGVTLIGDVLLALVKGGHDGTPFSGITTATSRLEQNNCTTSVAFISAATIPPVAATPSTTRPVPLP